MNNRMILESLASDLKRVSMGLQRGSTRMADRFLQEAFSRREQIDISRVKPYVAKLLQDMQKQLLIEDVSRKAENALFYSTLFQNAAQNIPKPTLDNLL